MLCLLWRNSSSSLSLLPPEEQGRARILHCCPHSLSAGLPKLKPILPINFIQGVCPIDLTRSNNINSRGMPLFRFPFKKSIGTPDSSENNQGRGLHHSTTLEWKQRYKKTIRTTSYKDFVEKAGKLRFRHDDEIQDIASPLDHQQNDEKDIASPLDHQHNDEIQEFISFGLIVDQLLEPDEGVVNQKLNKSKQKWRKIETYNLMRDFFDRSLEACTLCGMLIDFIEQAKHYINCFKKELANLEHSQELHSDACHQVVERLYEITNMENPFPDLVLERVKGVCNSYNTLHNNLDMEKAAVRKKVRFSNSCKLGVTVFVVVAVAGVSVLAVLIATHGVASLVIVPLATLPCNFIAKRKSSLVDLPSKFFSKQKTQLDAAARESYCIKVSLQTIDYLVTLLHADFSKIKDRIKFVWDHQELFREVIEELTRKPEKVLQDMEGVEEKVYYLLQAINRARGSVIREISRM